jgi:hypothetical protein
VISSGGMWPLSPIVRRLTLPLALTSSMVMDPLYTLVRSQASGGSWSAFITKYLITLPAGTGKKRWGEVRAMKSAESSAEESEEYLVEANHENELH